MKLKKSTSKRRAKEQLRQERDAFDQHKRKAERWFLVWQLIVGASILILLAILGIAMWVITHPDRYNWLVIGAAVTAVFGEILGAMLFVWKTTVRPDWNEPVKPITGHNN